MTEMTMTRLYEVMVILYAIGIVFYFIDYLYKYVKARRVAFWFVCIAWVMQSVFFILFIIETQRFPILSLFEGIYFYAWLLTTLSIVLHCIARVDMPVFFVNVLSFVFVTIHLFAPTEKVQPMVDSLVSEMLVIHISFAIMSYAAFSLSFVFSMLYLILYRILKQKKAHPLWSRLPSLQQTSSWMSNSMLVGVPLLFISLILGLEWALMTLDRLSVFDIKIIGSFIITVIYLIILLLHRSGKLMGTSYAWIQIYAYLLTVVNFFLGNKMSNFHLWY
ncbi:cytochrome C assembly family protein [Lysinibacillus odysseyi]|uniref:Cytochrome C assembly protein n=1 Tax=Lysinibacillus odysseyi 34hs-1 = NBRC 100172 TaxID=1220589 RepID=A0A0A3J8P1_9BACI|nr:cytochrome c biogenesis protein CcsA [Lysinibacillus odysseyi]KGR83402.1 cytochrome C assembly protein [Lysinibacillus odysseyi 34hs-1 = NBRC 100172]